MAGAVAVACAVGLASCGPAADDSQTHVNVSTSGDTVDTVMQQTTVIKPTDTIVQQRVDTVVRHDVDTVVRRDTVPVVPPRPQSSVSATERASIDAWLTQHADSLNRYGDPRNTVYAGGTPLFNEATGQRIDRYDYIVSKHPDRPWMAITPSQPRR
jgi:hypothetical protein